MAEEIEIEIEKKDEYPEFSVPSGLDLSSIEEDGEKEVLATIRKKPDGKACIIAVEGFPLGDNDGDEQAVDEEEEEVADEDYASSIMSRASKAGLM